MDYGLLLKESDGSRYHENHRLFTTDKYTNILEAWEATSYWPQTSCGLNHTRRDVVVADYDGNCASFLRSFSGKIPPSYILINRKSNNVQAGWLLDEPYDLNTEKEKFLTIKNCINSLCPDKGFTGWQIKNPFYEEFTPYHFVMNKYSKKEIEKNFYIKERVIKSKTKPTSSLNSFDNKQSHSKGTRQTGLTANQRAGRNNLTHHYAIKFVSRCKTEGIDYDLNTVVSYLKSKQPEICTEVGKTEPLPESEITSCAKSALAYVERKYNPILAKNGRFGNQARIASLITRRANAEARAKITWEYYQQGMSARAIAKTLGVGRNTVLKDLEFMKSKA